MTRWLLASGVMGLIGAWWLWRRSQYASVDRPVSSAWLTDTDRRARGAGIDQVGVQRWPINKVKNEAAAFNAARLRRRA